jgi:hypothetical protein
MERITEVVFTDLFWSTLEKYTDSIFTTDPDFKGVWHAKLSRNPDVILFYTLSGTALNAAMIGSHHDYSYGGQRMKAGKATAKRIAHAIQGGHVETPGWKIRWRLPVDLVANPDLEAADIAELRGIMQALVEEAHTNAMFDREHGKIEDVEIEVLERWIDHHGAAVDTVKNILVDRELAMRRAPSAAVPASRALGAFRAA